MSNAGSFLGWVKYLTDGTCEQGYDYLVRDGLASWRRGRQDMDGVGLVHFIDGREYHIWIWGKDSEWWQSDRMQSNMSSGPAPSTYISRRIMRKITPQDQTLNIIWHSDRDLCIHVLGAPDTKTLDAGQLIPITPDMVGQWVVLSIDIGAKLIHYQFLPDKV